MKTVKQISSLTGVSVRTLHHYDSIGLLKPTAITEAGYRLYDDVALQRLQQILLLRELGFPLKDIQAILDAPEETRRKALDDQIQQLDAKRRRLQDKISLAAIMKVTEVNNMDFEQFDAKKMDDYSAQAKIYTCTKPILMGLGQMYAGGGSMTENIDHAGGAGTGEFARQAIDFYCKAE